VLKTLTKKSFRLRKDFFVLWCEIFAIDNLKKQLMKKLLLAILTISASFAINTANAQWCGTVNHLIANPNAQVGFPYPDSIPCATQGVAYNEAISFKMYSVFNFLGQQTIDSVTIDTIWNLPCGLCWTLNKASKTYAANEYGVLNVSGTTNDVVGQYNLRLQVTAYINHNSTGQFIQNPNTVDAAGIKIWIRVKSAAGQCAATDTSINGTDQVAATTCPTGINEIEANVASINIMPNPMNSNALLSFTAEKNAAYMLKITDVTGKLISAKQIQAVPGVNTATIERGNLSAGIYLLSLSDGVSSITRKIIIAE
jgi:hypothetical protein